MCLKEENWNLYISYIKNVRKNCFNDEEINIEFSECSQKVFENNIDDLKKNKIRNCMNFNSNSI